MHLVREIVLVCSVCTGLPPSAMATILRLCRCRHHRTVQLGDTDHLPRHVRTQRWHQSGRLFHGPAFSKVSECRSSFTNRDWNYKSGQRPVSSDTSSACRLESTDTTSPKGCPFSHVLHRSNVCKTTKLDMYIILTLDSACICSAFQLAYRVETTTNPDTTWILVPLGIVTYVSSSLIPMKLLSRDVQKRGDHSWYSCVLHAHNSHGPKEALDSYVVFRILLPNFIPIQVREWGHRRVQSVQRYQSSFYGRRSLLCYQRRGDT